MAQPVRITVDAASLDAGELRARIGRWMPEVAEASDSQICAAVEDTLADAAIRDLAALRMGMVLFEASFRASLRRQMVASVEVL